MTIKEAKQIEEEFNGNNNPTEEEIFLFTEAMNFLIEEMKNPGDMMHLGGFYYEMKRFDLALKYYEMAATMDYDPAYECLGYIWYYGRTGEKDYKKAFEYFSKVAEKGNIVAKYKIADMYKNGYYVEKNQEKYEEIIQSLYNILKEYEPSDDTNVFFPYPEIWTRLAKIKKDRGELEKATELYLEAKRILEERIRLNAFFGNLNIMMWLIDDLYNIIDFDKENFDFYDLYYLLKTPHKIRFRYEDKEYLLESVMEGEECTVNFNGKWFHNRSEFFGNATIREEKLTDIYDDLFGFEVIE